MTQRPAIGLADCLQARRALALEGEADLQALSRQLGLAPAAPAGRGAAAGSASAALPPADTAPTTRQPVVPAAEQESPPPGDPTLAPGRWQRGPLQVEQLAPLPPALPPPWTGAAALPAPTAGVDAALDPLLDSRAERALLVTLAATALPVGDIDLPRLIDAMARGRLPRRLPQRPHLVLRRGLQVLIDGASGMQPFARDALQLVAALRRLLPAHRLQVGHLLGGPELDCWLAGASAATPWQPTPDRAPLLLLTDLGIGGQPRAASDWLRLAQAAAEAGISVRALVPQARSRWPRQAGRALIAWPWERALSIGQVQRRVRESRT